jgi:predicted outer membrane repeat protein
MRTTRRFILRLTTRQPILLLLTLIALAAPTVASAGGKVTLCATDRQGGTGLNLANALAFGGTVTFDCKPGTTIEITETHPVNGRVEIDGGDAVTLKTNSYRAMFVVSGDLTLRRLSLRQPYVGLGNSPGHGGIAVGSGALSLIDSQVRRSQNPFTIETIRIERTLFENNPTSVLVRAGIAVISGSDFVNNDGAIVLRSNRPQGSGQTTVASITDSRFRNNGTAIWWTGRLDIKKSAFDNNRGNRRSDGAIRGGAIRLEGQGFIEHTTFDHNTATEGGAIWLVGGSLSLRRTTFRDNTALKDGGAVGIGDLAEGSIISRYSTFVRNKAACGGAIKLASSGAAIALQGGPNTFARNSAALGGAIYSELGRIQLVRAVFTDNSASGEGGAIFASRRGSPLATVLANSLVVRNTAPDGSAISGSAVALINSTVADNKGIAIALKPLSHFSVPGARGEIDLRNSIVSNNAAGNCSRLPLGHVAVQNGHNLQYPGSECGGTVASADPQLDALYVPQFGSPAYASGDNAICLAVPISSKDVYGAVRPQGGACTIGAVEGEIDPRLFWKLLWRLNERVRQNVAAVRSLWK